MADWWVLDALFVSYDSSCATLIILYITAIGNM